MQSETDNASLCTHEVPHPPELGPSHKKKSALLHWRQLFFLRDSGRWFWHFSGYGGLQKFPFFRSGLQFMPREIFRSTGCFLHVNILSYHSLFLGQLLLSREKLDWVPCSCISVWFIMCYVYKWAYVCKFTGPRGQSWDFLGIRHSFTLTPQWGHSLLKTAEGHIFPLWYLRVLVLCAKVALIQWLCGCYVSVREGFQTNYQKASQRSVCRSSPKATSVLPIVWRRTIIWYF